MRAHRGRGAGRQSTQPPWLDARLVNLAQSDAEVAAVLRRMGVLGNHWTHADMTRCRYVLDVDGNVNSWGYFWKVRRDKSGGVAVSSCCLSLPRVVYI